MNLSIWILQDWLGSSVKQTVCKKGAISIEGIKLYSPSVSLDKNILYIGISDHFFKDGNSNIVCQNQDDYIVLNNDDLIGTVNQIQDAFRYYSVWHNNCLSILRNGGSLNDLLQLSTELFPTPVIVVDAAQTIVAVSSAAADFQSSEEWAEAIHRGSVSDQKLKYFNLEHPEMYSNKHVFPVAAEYFFTKGYCKHIFINGSRRASLILKDPEDNYSKGRLQIFDLFCDIVGSWIEQCSASDTSFRINSYFGRALEGNKDAVQAMLRQTNLFGWDDNCTKALFVLDHIADNISFDIHMISNLTHEAEGTYAMIHDGHIVILSNNDIVNTSDFSNTLNHFMKIRSCVGAVSFIFTDMELIEQAYRLALLTLDNNPAISGMLYHCQNTSFRRIIEILNEQTANTLQHPAIGVLKDFDNRNKTDYCKTLFCYIKNERHHALTSEELFIHRNTLFQRLQKIQEIWPLNLDNPEERFHLLTSFYQEQFKD